jgi:hypothetical protein
MEESNKDIDKVSKEETPSAPSTAGTTGGDAPNTSADSLTQMERDVQAKAAARAGRRISNTRPGAVAVDLIEKDLAADTKNHEGPNAKVLSKSLSQTEQEVAAKAAGRSASGPTVRPGAVSVDSSPSQNQVDAITKSRLRRESAKNSNDKGTVPNASDARLSQFEEEVRAKQRGRPGNVDQSKPGAVAVASGSSLQTLENHVARKVRREDENLRRRSGGRETMSQMEKDIEQKNREQSARRAGGATGSASLRQLEDEVDSKLRARPNQSASQPGVTSVSGSLMELEGEVERKNTANSDSSRGQVASLTQLEQDVSAKARAARVQVAPAGAVRGTLEEMESDIVRKNTNDNRVVDDGRSGSGGLNVRDRPVEFDDDRSLDMEVQNPSVDELQNNFQDSFASRGESGPAETPGIDDEQAESSGNHFQTFAADTVLTATSALVVDEEEEKEQERQRARKFYCRIVMVCIIIAGIVAAVVATTSGGDSGDGQSPTSAPTEQRSSAPSPLPSASPTSSVFAEFLEILRTMYDDDDYFLEVFGNMLSPQYQAAVWATEEDEWPREGLSHEKFIQRFALATFYFSTLGDDWRQCNRLSNSCGDNSETNWLSNNDECTWLAIQCDDTGMVTRLFLDSECQYIIMTFPISPSVFT